MKKRKDKDRERRAQEQRETAQGPREKCAGTEREKSADFSKRKGRMTKKGEFQDLAVQKRIKRAAESNGKKQQLD